jgi:hypothetical protein
MISLEKAKELRNAQKKFWANWKKIEKETNETNEKNQDNLSWQYYEGLEGVGDPSFYPEVTNYEIAKHIIEGIEPSEEILYILKK